MSLSAPDVLGELTTSLVSPGSGGVRSAGWGPVGRAWFPWMVLLDQTCSADGCYGVQLHVIIACWQAARIWGFPDVCPSADELSLSWRRNCRRVLGHRGYFCGLNAGVPLEFGWTLAWLLWPRSSPSASASFRVPGTHGICGIFPSTSIGIVVFASPRLPMDSSEARRSGPRLDWLGCRGCDSHSTVAGAVYACGSGLS